MLSESLCDVLGLILPGFQLKRGRENRLAFLFSPQQDEKTMWLECVKEERSLLTDRVSLSCTRGNQNQINLAQHQIREGARKRHKSALATACWMSRADFFRPASLREGSVWTGLQFEKPVRCILPFLPLLGCQNIYLTS